MQVNSVAGILIASVFPYDSKSLVVVSFTESCALLDLSHPPPPPPKMFPSMTAFFRHGFSLDNLWENFPRRHALSHGHAVYN